jgi:hypothetical protein
MTSDTVSYIFDNMPENIYSFKIYNIDRYGNKSVASYLTAKSYGARFAGNLPDRICTGYEALNFDRDISLDFGSVVDKLIGVFVTYTHRTEGEKNIWLSNDENRIVLPKVDVSSPVTARTAYLPEPSAIDTFFSAPVQLFDPDNLSLAVSNSSFAAYKVDGFDTNYDSDPSILWNGVWSIGYPGGNPDWNTVWAEHPVWYTCFLTPWSNQATWFTFEVGTKVKLAKYQHHYYYPFYSNCPLYWEIWAFTGGGAPTAADGWNNWEKIGEGNTDHLPNMDAADQSARVAAYPLGETITFSRNNTPTAQYYRFKCVENWRYKSVWDFGGDFSLSEILLWVYLD